MLKTNKIKNSALTMKFPTNLLNLFPSLPLFLVSPNSNVRWSAAAAV